MATVAYTTAMPDSEGDVSNVTFVTWTPLIAANLDGRPFTASASADRSVQVTGNFDGGSCTIQWSNDGTNWVTANDPWENPLVFTAAGGKQIMEISRYIRPLAAGAGGSMSLTVVMTTKRVPY